MMKTSLQEKFVENFCRSGNATQSAIDAGYSEHSAKHKGYQLTKQFAGEIAEKTQKLVAEIMPSALSELRNLVSNAESESVKLGAIKDVLDRAGLKPVERIEQTNVEQMSTSDIQKELDALRLRH